MYLIKYIYVCSNVVVHIHIPSRPFNARVRVGVRVGQRGIRENVQRQVFGVWTRYVGVRLVLSLVALVVTVIFESCWRCIGYYRARWVYPTLFVQSETETEMYF
jgi:hypothetical protein